ncbi:MAG: helix-turn-helix transcriptional regulator [Bacteroidia bacterium]|nr:helix-turn-helix transcriptional regulator [Bacteroidia bacterium]
MDKPLLNRLKVVLAEKRKTNRWLAQQLGYNETTVSRWVNNKQQPSLATFHRIAQILGVDVKSLFESTTQAIPTDK